MNGAGSYFPAAAVRSALKIMASQDILDALELAVDRINFSGAEKGWDYSVSAYFAGILWKKLKANREENVQLR